MKILLRDLRRFITESADQIQEVDRAVPRERGDSLDSQVDNYLTQYEGEAKSSKNEGHSFRTLIQRILSEAEDDDEKPAPTKLSVDDIDVDSFVNSVIRLINNYDNLLEVRSTLVRRAKNFLSKNYDVDVVESFDRTLREEHGIVPGESKNDITDDKFQAPKADRAGDGGGGAT